MSPKGSVFFDVGETLGAAFVDPSGNLARLEAYSYVPARLERLKKEGVALGVISDIGFNKAQIDDVLKRSGVHPYFSDELLIYGFEAGLRKDSLEIFELAMERAQRSHGLKAEECVFVGEGRVERMLATLAGMRAAPHPLLAEAALAGERPTYFDLRIPGAMERIAWDALEDAPVVPVYRAISDGTARLIVLSTDGTARRMQEAGFDVTPLSDKADAVRDDLYLLRDAAGLDQDAAFTSALTARSITPILSLSGGLIVALPSHQNIDSFHVGKGHGHNLKLLADMTILPSPSRSPDRQFPPALSPQEMQSIDSVINEAQMREALRIVSGLEPRPPVDRHEQAADELPSGAGPVGANRHVLSAQMQAVTDGLMAHFQRIGRGTFEISGHRFYITGQDVRDVHGVPVSERIALHNVIAELPGESDELVLVTAHLDSTAVRTYGTGYDPKIHDAPGMDDDGSGVAAVLLIAEVMQQLFANRKPLRTIRFVLFNAEEQGLIGSERYARYLAESGKKIAAVFQMDMIGYNVLLPNTFETHAGTSQASSEPEDADTELKSVVLADLIRKMSELLAREKLSILVPAQVYKSPDPAAGRSDHSSFQRRGYAACATTEDFFPTPGVPEERNPNYHMATDQVIDPSFATSIARVVCAATVRASDPGPANVAELLLHYLKLENVKYLFGIPGASVARILATLEEPQPKKFFQYVVTRHETGAAYMAEGYFRATGDPGVVLVTSGPGATNALTGTLTAEFGGSAVLTITGEPSEEVIGRGALQEGIEAGLDVPAIYGAATNYSANVTDPTSAKTLIEQALRDAMSVPRHAVHLSIPDNIANESPPAGRWITAPPDTTERYRTSTRGVPRSDDVKEVCDILHQAKRPLILLGSGCREVLHDSVTAKALLDLVDKYAIPVMTTMDGKGLFPESHDLSLRVYGFASCRWPHHWLRQDNSLPHDALLVIGSALGALSTNKWHPMLIPRGPFIQVDIDQRAIGRAFPVTHGVVADAGEFIRALWECLRNRTPDGRAVDLRRSAIQQIKSRNPPFAQKEDYTYPDQWSDYNAGDGQEGIEPAALIRILQEFVGLRRMMIFIDAGNCVGWGAHYFVVDPEYYGTPTEYHSTLGMGPMGFGVASVIGAKLGKNSLDEKDWACLALVGDGAFLMHGAEISTATQYGIGSIWIVLEENDLNMVTQGMRQYTRGAGNFEGLYNLGGADLVQFAQSLGARAERVNTQVDLRNAVRKALQDADTGRPQVVVVSINPKRVPPYYIAPYVVATPAVIQKERGLLAGFFP